MSDEREREREKGRRRQKKFRIVKFNRSVFQETVAFAPKGFGSQIWKTRRESREIMRVERIHCNSKPKKTRISSRCDIMNFAQYYEVRGDG